jgi:hypothetical protein
VDVSDTRTPELPFLAISQSRSVSRSRCRGEGTLDSFSQRLLKYKVHSSASTSSTSTLSLGFHIQHQRFRNSNIRPDYTRIQAPVDPPIGTPSHHPRSGVGPPRDLHSLHGVAALYRPPNIADNNPQRCPSDLSQAPMLQPQFTLLYQ